MSIRSLPIISLFLAAVTLMSCGGAGTSGNVAATKSNGASNNPNYGYSCSFTEFDEFSVFQDPTQNFTSTNATLTSSIVNNICSGISNGVASTENLTSATRVGSVITFTDATGPDSITLSGDQATVLQSDLTQCINGTQATGVLSQVDLNQMAGTIAVYINWTLEVNDCTQSASPSGQGAPGRLVINAAPLPSPSPTISPSPSPSPSQGPPTVAFTSPANGDQLVIPTSAEDVITWTGTCGYTQQIDVTVTGSDGSVYYPFPTPTYCGNGSYVFLPNGTWTLNVNTLYLRSYPDGPLTISVYPLGDPSVASSVTVMKSSTP